MGRLEAAGFLFLGAGGGTMGPGGERWPGISWPPEDPHWREHSWQHLQNVARAEAQRKGIRVLVYGYKGPDEWEYTIGDEKCRDFAYRPGIGEEDSQ